MNKITFCEHTRIFQEKEKLKRVKAQQQLRIHMWLLA
jgi:hypothetical protein